MFERFVDEPWRFGFVREIERGIDVRLERKLMQQRETERVDGGDGDVANALAELDGKLLGNPAFMFAACQLDEDALPHLRGRLARESDGQDVARLDAGGQQRHIAIHEHPRLARTR